MRILDAVAIAEKWLNGDEEIEDDLLHEAVDTLVEYYYHTEDDVEDDG